MPRFATGRFGALLATVLVLGSCRDSGDGDRFAISGKLFVFNYRVATANYLVTLKALAPMREGDIAVAMFEDPAGGEAIIVRQKIWPKLDKVTLESPPLRCIVKDRPYAVSIRIEDIQGKVLQTMETTMASSQDQTVLPDRPLVVGPLYTPNPELAGHPDGQLPEDGRPPCEPPAQ